MQRQNRYWSRRDRLQFPGRERANIDKHHRDFLFDSTQSRIARQDLFSRPPPDMQTKRLSQPLLIFELARHVIELAKQ